MTKTVDIQSWLDYFEMLQRYEIKGYLWLQPDKHEAYITEPALFTLSPDSRFINDSQKGVPSVAQVNQMAVSIPNIAKRIRDYAGWKSQRGSTYLTQNFALHVVKDYAPHDMLYTILLTHCRLWWRPWYIRDHIDVIEYIDGEW